MNDEWMAYTGVTERELVSMPDHEFRRLTETGMRSVAQDIATEFKTDTATAALDRFPTLTDLLDDERVV